MFDGLEEEETLKIIEKGEEFIRKLKEKNPVIFNSIASELKHDDTLTCEYTVSFDPETKKPSWFKRTTFGLRKKLGLLGLRLFTPKLHVEVLDHLNYLGRTPRPFTLMLKKHFGDTPLKGVEVGFGYGFNAVSLLENLNIEKLYCVDPFIGKKYIQNSKIVENYVDSSKSCYQVCESDKRVQFVEKPSVLAFRWLPRDLDFVYVDAIHEYNSVISDLNNAFRHIKIGGFVGGHDFARGAENNVISAVLDFAVYKKIAPIIKVPDFWFENKLRF
jgi:hypothetical protein